MSLRFRPIASGSSGNCYLLSDGDAHILIEAGIPFAEIQRALWSMDLRISSIDFCLISHSHGDHAKALRALVDNVVVCYLSRECRDKVIGDCHMLLCPLESGSEYYNRRWTILPFDVDHDEPGTLGFIVRGPSGEKILYASDCAYLRHQIPGMTIIAVEANFDPEILKANVAKGLHAEQAKRVLRSHMSIDTVIDMLRKNDLSTVREIWLLHLSDGNSDAAEFVRRVESATGVPTRVAGSIAANAS